MVEPPSRPPPPLPPPRFTRSAVWQYYQKFFQKMSTLANLVSLTLLIVLFFFFSYMNISHRIKKHSASITMQKMLFQISY